jgi:hypothetical protein
MRTVSILKFAVGAAMLAASSASAMAGGWGYGNDCGCGGCGCGGAVAVTSYTPVTTYQAYTVYRPMTVYKPTTSYVASVSYDMVPYEQAYVVDHGPRYMPAATGYRTASYTYDEPRRHRYIDDGGYRVRYKHHGWRHHHRAAHRALHGGARVHKRHLPPVGYK